MDTSVITRAQGCLLGQLAGDALGGLVEFQSPEQIRRAYPNGVRELADGGTWGTLAGQPTDDSEMALALARMLVAEGQYAPDKARDAYVAWLESGPFDCGFTVSAGLRGTPNRSSQANGALMRASPLGIFGALRPLHQVAEWARRDAALTHPNPVCIQANALFVMAVAEAIRTGVDGDVLYQRLVAWMEESTADPVLEAAVLRAADAPPEDFVHQQGWVVIAFQNALWQLLHARDLEAGVVDTVMRGGDTDTNAAICGALLGAVHGRNAVPAQWVQALQDCRPRTGDPRVRHPRPEQFWPVDVLELAERLVRTGGAPGDPAATAGRLE